MKTLLKILFVIFILWMIVGVYLLNTTHPKAQVVMGLGALFMSLILMPTFIYHRYKDGKYKKYVINNNQNKKADN